MAILAPFNLNKWIDEHRHLLKPPVGNQQIFKANDDFIVMVVGGPNSRKDFHFDKSEELFYQLEGDMVLRVFDEGKIKDIEIKEGDMFLLPACVPHSPQRKANTIGLVIERYRKNNEQDGFIWYCENCEHKLHEVYFDLEDIVTQLSKMMEHYYSSLKLRTCSKCGTVMEPPQKL
jgi:3-hydroxyanthranilate 3,4-dioxygenase